MKSQLPSELSPAKNIEQAIERAGTKSGNKGYDAAMAAMEMANLLKDSRALCGDGKQS